MSSITGASFFILITLGIISSISGFPLPSEENSSSQEAGQQQATTGNPPTGVNGTNGNETESSVVYSYAEAIVQNDGVPSVRQMTIVKGKDGEVRYSKNENGTVETGKWEGPIPSPPSFGPKLIQDEINMLLQDPLTKLNQHIGSGLQDYFFKTFGFF